MPYLIKLKAKKKKIEKKYENEVMVALGASRVLLHGYKRHLDMSTVCIVSDNILYKCKTCFHAMCQVYALESSLIPNTKSCDCNCNSKTNDNQDLKSMAQHLQKLIANPLQIDLNNKITDLKSKVYHLVRETGVILLKLKEI